MSWKQLLQCREGKKGDGCESINTCSNENENGVDMWIQIKRREEKTRVIKFIELIQEYHWGLKDF